MPAEDRDPGVDGVVGGPVDGVTAVGGGGSATAAGHGGPLPGSGSPGAGRAAPRRVGVLGGGVAGLAVAWHAARAGAEVILWESAPVLGGMARSLEVDGIRVDLGSHRLHPAMSPRVRSDLVGLLGGELQRRPRRGRLLVAGRWVSFPLRPLELPRRLPPATAARLAAGLLRPVPRSPGRTFAEEARRRLGDTAAELVHLPFARKLWGVDPEGLDAELARRRIGVTGPWAVVGRALRRHPGFLYPAGGFGRIPEAVAAAARAAGADLRTARPVRRLERRGALWGVTAGDDEPVEVDVVISTVPPTVLARLLGFDDVGPFEHRGVVCLYLVVPGRPWTPFDAHYVPDPDVPFHRVSEPTAYRDGDDPTDRTALCFEIPASVGDRTWRADPAELVAAVTGAAAAIGLPRPDPVAVHVERLPAVYPVWRPDTASRLAWLEERLASLGGIRSVGRQGLFVGDNTHHVLAMAAAVVDTLGDDGAWARARRSFDAHVVED